MSKHRLLKNVLLDAVLAAAGLVVFALFHHVLPSEQQSLNIATVNPYATVQTASSQSVSADSALSNDDSSGEEGSGFTPEVYSSGSAVYSGSSDSSTRTTSGSSKTSSLKSGKSSRSSSSRSGGSFSGGVNSSSKGGSSSAGSTAVESDLTPISQKFSDKYTDTVVVTDTSYTSPDISISVSEETTSDGKVTYYIADIYLRDITCFQTAFANDTYGSGYRDSITDMVLLSNALVAVNGDYYGNTTEGVVIRNGVIYRANYTDCDVCVLYYDGSMRVIKGSDFSVDEAIADGAWQAWTFGPGLLDSDGGIITSFNSTSRIISANPRTAIGYYEPGHYCLIVVDGRGESSGMSLSEMSRLFNGLGCKAAYNLDGGNSSIMVWQDEIINNPSGGGRESSDALLIAEVNKDA